MKTFTLNDENIISVYVSKPEAEDAQTGKAFATEAELAKVTGDAPLSRLIDTWNGLPGVVPVKKFKDRKTAVARVWAAIQGLTPAVAPQAGYSAPKKGKAA